MEYSNPEIPEGINTSKTHPLREFAWLVASVSAFALVIVLVLTLLADLLAGYIPFSVERHFAGRFEHGDTARPQLQAYLQGLADRVAQAQGLPPEMPVTVHYVDNDTVNAFATLGGHVLLFRGLLEQLPNENALALLIGHEVAHIKHRDPMRGLGRGVVLGLALTVVSESVGNAVLDSFLDKTSYLTVLKFSRGQEAEADAEAAKTVQALYGTLQGADALMRVLVAQEQGQGPAIEFLSSHPLSEKRLQRLQAARGDAPAPQATALPPDFAGWLKASHSPGKE